MKKIILGLALGLAAVTAQANEEGLYKAKYTCEFTEPFLTVVYNASAQTVTVDDMGKEILKVSRVSSKQEAKSNSLLVVDSRGKEVLKIEAIEGSNGMSDKVYPFTGTYEGHIGGCDLALTK